MIDTLTATLAPTGLNLVGAATAARYDAGLPVERRLARLAPGALGAIVLGNGGGVFWAASGAEDADDPDPIDAYTRRVVAELAVPLVAAALGVVRVVYPFEYPGVPVSFLRLAEAAGLGIPSLLGVLVHPRYGPWMALRAAILVPAVVDAARPADGFDPCPTCQERACMGACPAGAVTAAGWDVPRCGAWRARSDDPCAARCHARFDCVIGREHRYPAAALAYHQGRARPLLVEGR